MFRSCSKPMTIEVDFEGLEDWPSLREKIRCLLYVFLSAGEVKYSEDELSEVKSKLHIAASGLHLWQLCTSYSSRRWLAPNVHVFIHYHTPIVLSSSVDQRLTISRSYFLNLRVSHIIDKLSVTELKSYGLQSWVDSKELSISKKSPTHTRQQSELDREISGWSAL